LLRAGIHRVFDLPAKRLVGFLDEPEVAGAAKVEDFRGSDYTLSVVLTFVHIDDNFHDLRMVVSLSGVAAAVNQDSDGKDIRIHTTFALISVNLTVRIRQVVLLRNWVAKYTAL
jgi:hypothetical protein